MCRDLFIDVSRLLERFLHGRLPTGVDRVNLAYLQRFGSGARAVVQRGRLRRLASHETSRRLFELIADPGAEFGRHLGAIVAHACLSSWSSQDGAGGLYFNLSHTGIEDPTFSPWVRRSRLRPIFFVHDLIPLTHPEYCQPGDSERHRHRLTNMLAVGAGIVANSHDTLRQLENFASCQGQPMVAAEVAHLGSGLRVHGRHAPVEPPLLLPGPYFVVLGTIEPRKNHLLLLQVWRRLAEVHGLATPRLLVIGQRGWECENVIDLLERSVSIGAHVTELPVCSDAHLAHYLHHACALLFPSFVEGYGMPLAEALGAGLPVIASDLDVFREIAGAIPDYLSPLDGVGWQRAIEDYARPVSMRRNDQLRRLDGYVAPTWDAHFETVDRLMARLA